MFMIIDCVMMLKIQLGITEINYINNIYYNRNHLFEIVIIFYNVTVLLYFLSNKYSLGEQKKCI